VHVKVETGLHSRSAPTTARTSGVSSFVKSRLRLRFCEFVRHPAFEGPALINPPVRLDALVSVDVQDWNEKEIYHVEKVIFLPRTVMSRRSIRQASLPSSPE